MAILVFFMESLLVSPLGTSEVENEYEELQTLENGEMKKMSN